MEKVLLCGYGRWTGWLCSVCYLALSCFSTSVFADELPVIDISELNHQRLQELVEYFEADPQTPLEELQNRQFQPLTRQEINQGISDKAYWVRFRLSNPGDAPRTWVLLNDTSFLDNLVVHYRDRGTNNYHVRHLSDRQPFHTRDLDYRNLSFRHTTPSGSYTDVYVKLYFDKAESMSLNLHLWDEAAFWQEVREENLIYGGYYGTLFILVLLSLTFGILLRQLNALYYAVFLLATAAMWLLLNGYAYQYLWPNSVYWHNEGFHIAYLLFVLFALQFSKTFLRTRNLQPRVHRVFSGLQLLALAGLALRAAGNYGLVLNLAFGLLFLVAFVIPLASWNAYRRGLNYARWYTLAWAAYSASLVICVISAYSGALQWGMHVLDYSQAGSLLEAIFLMIAMSEWLLSLDSDRRKALALAHQDPLTGLGNRRLLQMQYEQFREQFHRNKQAVFLIMLDLDHFKRINDTYGHDAGDHVLKAVADLVRKLSRDEDVCIRYGGEEFAILLPADNIDVVWQVAERIRTQFASSPTPYNGQLIEHTLSGGITPVLSGEQMLSVQEMMSRADAALYEGKNAGRNRNIIYSGCEAGSPEPATD